MARLNYYPVFSIDPNDPVRRIDPEDPTSPAAIYAGVMSQSDSSVQ